MTIATVLWITLPLWLGFLIYLVPRLDRGLTLLVTLASIAYGLVALGLTTPIEINLMDTAGVSLVVDSLAGYFILTNAIVTLAVLLYCWPKAKDYFFYTQLTILHGSVNAVFICGDFMSLYVGLELIGIAAFLLVTYPRTDRSLWIGLRYLFISNTVMLFYLLGAVLVYQSTQSFAFAGLTEASPEAIALIMVGLLTKGGVFLSGLWLPLTHAEADTPISAILSGVVVKAGVFPLIRLALLMEPVDPLVRAFGVATALFGVTFAILQKDSKRMLAFHTISQLGFVLAAPIAGGLYALSHGIVKSALFLMAGNLPSRQFKELKHTPLPFMVGVSVTVASLSISGLPLLMGFGAKAYSVDNLLPWQDWLMNIAAVGTAISFAKFIFLPWQPFDPTLTKEKAMAKGFWPAIIILLASLFLGNLFYWEAYKLSNIIKAIVTILIGWFLYGAFIKKLAIKLPRWGEQLNDLVGMMSIILTLLIWWVVQP